MSLRLLLLSLAFGVSLAGCPVIGDDDDASDDDDSTEQVEFAIWGPDFVNPIPYDHPYEDECEQALPAENSCGNPNPEIMWEGVPEGTGSLALIFDDPTFQNYPHWAIFNIPPTETGLAAAISGVGGSGDLPEGSVELPNMATDGYFGSCPGGTNQYRWRLWALPEMLEASLYTALSDEPSVSFRTLADDADEVRLDRVQMCHVFRGSDAR